MYKNYTAQIRRIFYEYPILSFALGGGNIITAIFLYIKVVYFSISRKFSKKGIPMSFVFSYNRKNFSLSLENNLDLAVLIEIFVMKEYVWKPEHEVGTILDLGAHWGDTALYYACVFPASKIVAVEPMSSSFKRLEDHTKSLANITALHAALSDKSGTIELHYSENSVGNSIIKRDQSSSKEEVDALLISDLGRRTGISKFDLVKFDIEGAEQILFKTANLSTLGKSYIGEIHLDLIDLSLDDISEMFKDFKVSFNYLKKNRYIMTATAN